MSASPVPRAAPPDACRAGPSATQESPVSGAAAPVDSLAELVVAVAHDDERAFRRLYDATSAALFGIALRMLKRRDWAEEVLQESFVSVWRHAARYDRRKAAAMTWLIRIVRNQALDWIAPSRPDGFERVHALVAEDADDVAFEALPLTGSDERSEPVDYARRAERVTGCLERLDARQRQSIALVFFHGLSHGDLARHLRQPLGTVKAWVRRGLKSLRICLATGD